MVTFTVFLEFSLYTDFIDFTLKMATGDCHPKYKFEMNENILDLLFIILYSNKNE